MRTVELSLPSWPCAIASGPDAWGSATGAGAPQPSNVAARATPSQIRGEQRMIRLLLTTVASEVPNGFQRSIEVGDHVRFEGKPAQVRRLACTTIPRIGRC